MSQRIELNCIGMKSPQPIMEIAKAARTQPPGTVLVVRADDSNFEENVRAWAGTAKATIIRFDHKENNGILVELQLPG